MSAADQIRSELERVIRELGAPDGLVWTLERARDPAFGDWATNVAMVLAKPLGRKPRDIAKDIIERIDTERAGIGTAEIAGPGFINFRVSTNVLSRGLLALLRDDATFGRSDAGHGCPVNVEFVSANPTGPLHVGHGRQAALGDAIASLLEWTGWKVMREFYYNDAGAQINNLTRSVQARVREQAGEPAQIPEGGYHGEYIREIAQRYREQHPNDPRADDGDAIRRFAVAELRKEQDLDLQAFGVKFDTYYLETSLYTDGMVEWTVKELIAHGHTYEQDGALFLRTTDFGDDKDRVMRKSAEKGGEYTYFVPDVAYHVTKWRRGFTRAINVQGADHHSTVVRVRAGLQALEMGIPKNYPDYSLHQMVTLMRGGEEVKFSKRSGDIVTIRELVDEVGRDAMRYFFLMRKGDSQLTFDIDLAKKQSEENPVYYIQMGHARMSGVFRKGEIDPSTITGDNVDFDVLELDEEQDLIKALLDFPAVVAGAAESLEPHRIATYLHDTAGKAHLWYHKAWILNEPDAIKNARLVLARATQIVLRNGLNLIGITAPDRM